MIMSNVQQIYHMCKNKLDIKYPNYTDVNNIIAKLIDSITAPLRW